MIQTLNPYTPTAKTAEIMARYRPIAPKPQTPNASGGSDEGSGSGSGSGTGSGSGSGSGSSPSAMSPTIRQSPYLRNVWPHLQSRPTRTRKRGRTSLGPPPPATFKRPRTLLQGLSPPFHVTTSPPKTLSIQGFASATAHPTTLVTLPLLPFSAPHHMQLQPVVNHDVIDLNKEAEIPEEKDLLAQLQEQPSTYVISPSPIRLVPSTVTIRAIKPVSESPPKVLKKSEEIEKELESELLPGFVSDSRNQVRLVNSTYKQMVGQPECAWVQSMVTGAEAACKSICGKVVLNFIDESDQSDRDGAAVAVCSSGFSCWARIEWGMNGKKNLVNAFGEAKRVACESKDYRYAWRFHTKEALEAGSSL
ncbi:hypothetical protein SSX86_003760 [Deinandra increscens subsp. villosa]|uniref:DUF7950 domain-containing protein n=1 Tax=Deinandra increscens subsp. villosa TaxID=3103831 RepID=A0AAP0DMP7_9ASTR